MESKRAKRETGMKSSKDSKENLTKIQMRDEILNILSKRPEWAYEDFIEMCLDNAVMVNEFAKKKKDNVDLKKAYWAANETAQYFMDQMFSA